MELTRTQAEAVLQSRFGLPRFYDEQWETIEGLLQGQRILLIHRTGYGKSLCYQFPAILFTGTTIVFSPLIALMRDQVHKLKSLRIPAEVINSEQSIAENHAILDRAVSRKVKILYVAPERQENLQWIEAVRNIDVAMVVIDEAHCISVWGHDFRPAFAKIINLVKALPHNYPVLATTATATETVAQDIIHQMGGEVRYIRGNLMRENLVLNVVRVATEDAKLAFLAQNIPNLEGQGIIYSGTRANTEIYAHFLKRQNIDAVHYNAGFDPITRREIEDGFRNNRWKCLVATNALGMGIDKPDIRFIVHTQIPESPIHYYQEIGRAGRDGKKALIILLYNPADKELPEHFIATSKPPIEHYLRVIERLREKPLGMRGLLRRTNLSRTSIERIVSDLLNQDIIAEETAGRAKTYMYNSDAPPLDTTPFQRLREYKIKELAKIIEYAETDTCRLFYLCDYLEDKNVHTCQKCDKCRGRTLSYEPTATWQDRVDKFKTTFFPEIALVSKDQEEKPLTERKSKLVNGIAFSYYGFSTVGSTIHRCKYEHGGDFPDFIVEGVMKAYRSYFRDEQFDLMISVPPTESGNLVEQFAEKLSAKTGIPISHGLVKTRKTEPQKIYQNFSLKRSNVRGAFRYENPAEVKGKSILLVDDIYDSGATIKEIGKVMSRLGVHKIAPLVIAKTVRGDLRDDEPDGTVDTVAITSSTVKESKPLAAIRKKYPRAYEKWTKGDEKELLSMYNAGATIEELANHFQRKRSAITSRLTTLMSKDAILDVSKDASVDGSAASDGIASSRLKEAEIFQVLKKWRLETSKNQELPPYYIFPDKTLHHIAQAKPSSLLELLDVKGLGKKTVKRYGEELLALIKGCEAKHAEG